MWDVVVVARRRRARCEPGGGGTTVASAGGRRAAAAGLLLLCGGGDGDFVESRPSTFVLAAFEEMATKARRWQLFRKPAKNKNETKALWSELFGSTPLVTTYTLCTCAVSL